MEEGSQHQSMPFTPYKYPFWIIAFSVIVVLSTLYFLFQLPGYFTASKTLKRGEAAYKKGNYSQAIDLYKQVLKTVPSSKEAKIAMVEAIFSKS